MTAIVNHATCFMIRWTIFYPSGKLKHMSGGSIRQELLNAKVARLVGIAPDPHALKGYSPISGQHVVHVITDRGTPWGSRTFYHLNWLVDPEVFGRKNPAGYTPAALAAEARCLLDTELVLGSEAQETASLGILEGALPNCTKRQREAIEAAIAAIGNRVETARMIMSRTPAERGTVVGLSGSASDRSSDIPGGRRQVELQ